MNAKQKPPQWKKLALDLGPLLIFFAAYKFSDFFVATAAFMAAILASVAFGYLTERKFSPMLLVTAALVMVFGGLTIGLRSEVFLKIKPTVLYGFFAVVLLGGLRFNRLFIKYVFSPALELTDKGWRLLTWRWGLFFVFLAALNEVVWRTMSTDFWIFFKLAGVIPLTFLFALAQTPMVMRNQPAERSPGN
ncbi:MAG: septation protein A [Alphaproteobacteria bacterium]|nr:septation protein A [Alphaproteobacteria bacterium]